MHPLHQDPCMTVEQIEQNVVCACTIAGWANPDRAHHRKPHQHLQDIFLKKWLDKHMLIKFLTQQEGPAPSEMWQRQQKACSQHTHIDGFWGVSPSFLRLFSIWLVRCQCGRCPHETNDQNTLTCHSLKSTNSQDVSGARWLLKLDLPFV